MSTLLEQASLVLIPSGYKEDVVYSQIPTDGSGDLSFTRASTGTRINSAGLVEVCPWNAMQYSEDFTNAVYNKYNNITATADQTTAPNGTTTADKIGLSTASTTFPNLSQDAQYIGGQVYTFSVYLKKNTVNFGKIRVGGTAFASSTNSPIFNLNTGVVVSGTGTIENVGNGWYRCTMTAVADTSAAGGFAIDLPDSTGVWSGSSVYNANDSIFAWGYQANIGSTAKPYFPTTDRLNVPRLTYQNGGGGCPSLLLEKQSTNYLLWSQAFTNTWATYNGTTTDNETISPDGTQNASKVIMGAGNSATIRQAIGGLTNGSTYTFSLYIKQGSGVTAFLDISDTASTVNITPTSEWVRYTYTANWNTSLNFVDIELRGTSGSAYCYIWGAQLEASSYPTSYIPTTSSSATRVADACYKTGISSLVSASEYTLFWQGSHIATGQYNSFMTVLQTSNQNNSTRFYRNNSNNEIRAAIFNASNGLTLDLGSSVTTTRAKCALRVKNGDFALFVNGAKVNSNTTALAPSSVLDEINLQYFNNTQSFEQNCEMACFFKTALSDTEAIALTTI